VLALRAFQLIAINDKPNDPMEVWDTFAIPPKVDGVNGSLTFRVCFLQWHGKTVFDLALGARTLRPSAWRTP
jgi:hypothetical protein